MAIAEVAEAVPVVDGAEAVESTESRIAAIFRSWDSSGNGRISAEDLRTVLVKLGVPAGNVQVIFEAADAKRDGWIDYDEFLHWICSSEPQVQDVRHRLENSRVFAAVGVDDSAVPRREVVGGISNEELAELRAMTTPTPIVKRTFEALYLILNAAERPVVSKPPQWREVARMLRDTELGDRMRSFDVQALRAAPELCAYLVQHYFGPGGDAPPERLGDGQETLTFRRVQRASRKAARLFQWSCRELIDVGALLPPPAEAGPLPELGSPQLAPPQPTSPEPAPPEPAPPEPDPEAQARRQRNREQPSLAGELAGLPPRGGIVEPQQVLLQLMSGAIAEAAALAEALGSRGPCDRCDGAHHALDCPHFGPHKGHKAWTPRSRGREDHEDAWAQLGGGEDGRAVAPAEVVVRGRQIPQPGDGTCLYHSMAYGLRRAGRAGAGLVGPALRAGIADYLEANADERVSGSALRDYVWWDHSLTVEAYCEKMRQDGIWGGAIEIVVCTRMHDVNVHVYVPEAAGSFRRIAAFGDEEARPTLPVTYMLRCHYDALDIDYTA